MTSEDKLFDRLKRPSANEIIILAMKWANNAGIGPDNFEHFLEGHGWTIEEYREAYREHIPRQFNETFLQKI